MMPPFFYAADGNSDAESAPSAASSSHPSVAGSTEPSSAAAPESPSTQSGLGAGLGAIARPLQSIKIPPEAVGAVVGASITAVATLTIAIVNLLNGFNAQLDRPFQIQDSLSKTQLTADYYRQTALSTFLSSAGTVLIQSDRTANQVATLRAMSHATLQELNAERKRYVVMLLHDSRLLERSPDTPMAAPFFAGANLIGANLSHLDLHNTDLRRADLRAVNFRQSDLSHADLSDANLTGADLRRANLSNAVIDNAILDNACYNGRTVFDANVDPAIASMKDVPETEVCTPDVPSETAASLQRIRASRTSARPFPTPIPASALLIAGMSFRVR
jgi:hypothetical protein